MIDFFYKWYCLTNNSVLLKKSKIDALNRHIATFMANLVLPIYFRNKNYKNTVSSYNYKNRHRNIVASVTSFPGRIDKVWLSIESIFHQTVVPDVIVLWLSREQFKSIESLPDNLLALQRKGLRIELREGDLKSHKKYFYALKEYPGYDLFTFDDDIIYPSNALEQVLRVAMVNPTYCICRYSNQITLGEDEKIYWSRTKDEDINTPSYSTFCGSGGGTLYPSGSLPPITINDKVFMEISKTADDVWLNSMLRFNKIPVIAVMAYCPLLSIRNKGVSTLSDINIGDMNRRQFTSVRNYCIKQGFDIYDLIR